MGCPKVVAGVAITVGIFLIYNITMTVVSSARQSSLFRPKRCRNIADIESEYYILHLEPDDISNTVAILAKKNLLNEKSVIQIYDYFVLAQNNDVIIQLYSGGGFVLYDRCFYYNVQLCIPMFKTNIVVQTLDKKYILLFLEPMSQLGNRLLEHGAFTFETISAVISQSDLSNTLVLKTRVFKRCETAFYYDIPVVAINAKCRFRLYSY